MVARFRRVARRLFLREVWAIGLLSAGIDAVLDGAADISPIWLSTPPRDGFDAEPFPFEVNGRLYVLFGGNGPADCVEHDRDCTPENGVAR